MFKTEGLRLAGLALAPSSSSSPSLTSWHITHTPRWPACFNGFSIMILSHSLPAYSPACLSAQHDQHRLCCLLGSIAFWQRFSATLTNCWSHKQSLASAMINCPPFLAPTHHYKVRGKHKFHKIYLYIIRYNNKLINEPELPTRQSQLLS